MSNLVHCNQCSKSFNINPQIKKHGQGIKETYFRCTHCNERYIAFVTDAECRRLQTKVRKIHEMTDEPAQLLVEGKITEDEYNKRIDQIHLKKDKLQDALKVKMDRLKDKIKAKALT